jgi:hypothetical protein
VTPVRHMSLHAQALRCTIGPLRGLLPGLLARGYLGSKNLLQLMPAPASFNRMKLRRTPQQRAQEPCKRRRRLPTACGGQGTYLFTCKLAGARSYTRRTSLTEGLDASTANRARQTEMSAGSVRRYRLFFTGFTFARLERAPGSPRCIFSSPTPSATGEWDTIYTA